MLYSQLDSQDVLEQQFKKSDMYVAKGLTEISLNGKKTQ
jgi:hypothetical protein